MYCTECGFLLPEKVKFCTNCGVKIETIKFIEVMGIHFAFSAGRYYGLSEEYGNSFLTKASACKKELDNVTECAQLNIDRGGYHPDGEYPRRGFEKDNQGNWVYKKYKVADIEYYPELEVTEEFEIPERIRDKYEINRICYEAFWGCKQLRKVIIPKSVTRIDPTAFAGCENLCEIVSNGEWKSVGREAFLDTALYKNESNWTDGALYINNWLIKVKPEVSGEFVVLDGIVGIADDAFFECKNLTSIYIPDSVKYIGSFVFVFCSNVSNIRMPEKVESIGDSLFWHCENLTQIIMPEGTKKIKNEFRNCRKLSDIKIPDNVESVAADAFDNTPYENHGKWENDIFEYKNYLLKVSSEYKDKFIVPDRLTIISEKAFWWCDDITEIVISKSITRIENYAFINCMALRELIIPENVKWLGRDIFDGCDALRSVIILNPEVEIDEGMINYWSKPKYLVISGKEGSTAHKYAIKKNIPFTVIS